MTVALSTDNPAAVQIPASVAIPSLGTTVTCPLMALAVAVPTPVTITATVPGLAGVSVSLIVIPGPALAITSYALAPYSMIGPGVVTTATVTINQPAPVGGVTLSLFSNNPNAVKLPSTAAVATGQTSATFTIQGNGVSAATAVNLMASYSGPMAPLGANTNNDPDGSAYRYSKGSEADVVDIDALVDGDGHEHQSAGDHHAAECQRECAARDDDQLVRLPA